jgi:ABC-2 type transport system permease protein
MLDPVHTAALREPGTPVIGAWNGLGVRTLYMKEVRRFIKVQLQTLWAPAITMLLFLAVFTVGVGRGGRVELGAPYADFLAPGLIVMGMMQNAFANSSSSILIAKVQGTITDVLMPPLSPGELLVAWVGGALTRAWAVGLIALVAMLLWPGLSVRIVSLGPVLLFGTLGAVLLGLLGVLTGLWAEKFDHAAAVTNFLIQPLTLLSGTFFTLERLGPGWQAAAHANPFFFAIDGFRFGFLGQADGPVALGAVVLAVLVAGLWSLCWWLLRRGWRLKA